MRLPTPIFVDWRVPGVQTFYPVDTSAIWTPAFLVDLQYGLLNSEVVIQAAVWINDSLQPLLMGRAAGGCYGISGGRITKLQVLVLNPGSGTGGVFYLPFIIACGDGHGSDDLPGPLITAAA